MDTDATKSKEAERDGSVAPVMNVILLKNEVDLE